MKILALCLVLIDAVSGDKLFEVASNAIWIDLTYSYDETLPFHPLASPFHMQIRNGSLNGFWFQTEEISVNTHLGTHIDAPCHFVPGRWAVDEIPIRHLINIPAVVIDISEKVRLNREYLLEIEDILEWETEHGQVPKGSVLIMNTGLYEYFNDSINYFGITNTNGSEFYQPGLAPSAAQWIIDNRVLYGIGTDSGSIEGTAASRNNAHIIIEEQNIYSLESIANINKLPPKGAYLFSMPMKINKACGAPCRILALVPCDIPDNETDSSSSEEQ